MNPQLIKQEVGPWPMNSYILLDQSTHTALIIDPGADGEKILAHTAGANVAAIILTHGHGDHIGALDVVKQATNAPVYLHPKDADHFNIPFDTPLQNGQTLNFSSIQLKVIFTPGHTPGQCCLDLGDGRIIVGDTVFVGGPGRTWSAQDFDTTMRVMQEIVFKWPDETTFYPGHGPAGIIKEERPAFEAFVAKGWPSSLQGDVTWKK